MTTPATPRGLRGLPPFLRLLASYPSLDIVMQGLVAGPLARHGVRTCRLWTLREGDLVAIVGHGHTPEESDRYAVLPGQLDLAIWHAIRSGRPVITEGAERPSTDFGTIDQQFWARVLERVDAQAVVRAPLLLGSTPVGALGFITDTPWSDDARSADMLDTLTHALGLWISTPASGAAQAAERTIAQAPRLALAFTERQREILLLVGTGATNPEIARTLRLSVSLVKQELHSVMQALNTKRRREAPARARELGLL